MFRKLTTLFLVLMLVVAASAQVMINEVFYDTQSTDDPNLMFTEIYGPAGTNLTGWTLVGINGNGGAEYRTVTLSGTIPTDGYYVVGNTSSVTNVDYVCGGGTSAGVDWQNAGSTEGVDCDGIDLRDGDGALIDHLCYGTCANAGGCVGEGGTNAPDPFPSTANPYSHLARIPDHSDTDNNGTDWSASDTRTPGAPNSGNPCEPWITNLSMLRQNTATFEPLYLDTFVVVSGIVNVDNLVLDTAARFYIQDDDAGINLYRGTVPTSVVAGDCLTVSAWVGFYRGLTELVSSGSGNCVYSCERTAHVDPPEPTIITGSTPFEGFEGMLVRMNNVTIVDGDWPTEGNYGDLTITDGNGTIGLTINKWTNVDGSAEPTDTFHIIGILTQYDNSSPYDSYYEITPRSTDDVINQDAADDPAAAVMAEEFALMGNYPNPFNSATKINFMVGSARELSLTIYDVLGREVASEKLMGLTPGAHTYTWSPSCATGVYLLRLSGASRVETTKLLYLK